MSILSSILYLQLRCSWISGYKSNLHFNVCFDILLHTRLESDLRDVKDHHPEKETQKFLSDATCGNLQANIKCVTIDNYEEVGVVYRKGIKLEDHDSELDFYLSDIKHVYRDTIIQYNI